MFRYIALIVATLPAFGASCETLTSLSLPNATIDLAQSVDAGQFKPPAGNGKGVGTAYANLPAFCRVAATLKPSSDSDIKIEVWLPSSGWNNSLQSVGNGAWAGTISYPAMATALAAGYATASTDTGHTGNNADFILGHPEKLTDFAYRAVHETTTAAKAIVAAYYGRVAAHSYWNGCSTGGRQAMAEAQRYPGDYDGIIAGAPANYVTHLQGQQVWVNQVLHKEEGSYIPPQKYRLLNDAVLKACDALDGVKDGILEDPTRCHFDPKELACAGADTSNCLTPQQVEAARKIYSGPVSAKTGRPLFPGLERGSELGWATLGGSKPMSLAEETYKFIVFKDPSWNYMTFDPDRDMAAADKNAAAMMNSTDANLKPFFGHGGKLIMYHGWADPGIAPRNSVNYFENVVEGAGGERKAAESIRLFMVPGMGHCRGGGTDTFDAVGALSAWVEKGKAPERIAASRVTRFTLDRTRPLCPYPQTAVYNGSGNTDEAANFSCKLQ
ncbi:MAG: tannase/feruloyl esterase family alpha/beta hydrolase [Bryobacterales bacterium]|nr:tannase/feruloyl esterase family alpha/beta hydrolase [Bryobacterales bacterium]